ncbi:MFS transporter [Maridesulfovibrio hydrothermalis]|nr:MFS transporter [Maridesulfovibrio hydrothermalis]
MAAAFAAAMGTGVFSFTLPLISLDEKAGGLWLGTGFAGYFLAKLCIAPLSGFYADRTGVKKPLLLATGLAAMLPFLYLIHPSIKSLYAIQFALGLCAGTVRTVSMTAIAFSMRTAALSSGFARLAAVTNCSFLLGPLLGGLLYAEKDYSPVLWTMSAFMGAAFILFAFYQQSISSTAAPENREPRNHVSRKSYLYIMGALLGRAAGAGSLIAFYPLLIKSAQHLTPAATAMIYSVPSLATVALLPFCGRIFSTCERKFTASSGILLSSLGLYSIGQSTGIAGLIFSGFILGIGAAISIPASMSLCAEPGRSKGRTLGIANMTASLGFMAGPLFCGIAVSISGNISSPFKLIAITGAILTIPLLHQALRKKNRKIAADTFAAVLALLLISIIPLHIQSTGQTSRPDSSRYSDVAMGTIVNLTLTSPIQSSTEKIAQNTITLMRQLQKDFDHRNKLGSIGRINHAAGKKRVRVSDKAFKLIKRGLEISKLSAGNFDITIGAVTTIPFYYALDESRFSRLVNLVDFRLVEIEPYGNKVKLPLKGMALDLGGLAKGTIINYAAEYLQKSGIKTGLVEAGGDFLAFGVRVWSIGLRNPRGEGIIGTIKIKDRAVCSSGDYYQFITPVSPDTKTRKHHIFDPEKLRSSAESIATTAIAPDAETADALATAIFIMGHEKGTEFITRYFPDCAAMWILPDMTIKTTKNFPPINYAETLPIHPK